jgi:N-acetyl-gamma-glutamyl-phosphate reductase
MARPTIFIDGEHGTTGLQIRIRLEGRDDIELVSIAVERRKDAAERARILNSVDLAVLCLPDEAAREAVGLITNPRTRVIDGSTAHRVKPGWVYGFPEMTRSQHDAIRSARFVSIPGCYATAFVGLIKPLVYSGLVPSDFPATVNGVQGYSGGGRQLVDVMEGRGGSHRLAGPYRAYALELSHKHVPEMHTYSGLNSKPLFLPSVGAWRQGQIVTVPIHLRTLPRRVGGRDFHSALCEHYAGCRFVRVMPFAAEPPLSVLAPETLAGSNMMELYVVENAAEGHALLISRMDNLGKGASGQGAQDIDLMLGLEGDRDYEVPSTRPLPSS